MSEVKLEHPLPGERIEFVIKRHWIVFVFIGVYFLGALIITFTLLFFFFSKVWIYLILIIFWMAFLLFLYVKWFDSELDIFIITNNRIIGIEQISLLNRTVSECSLSQVQEVGSQTQGFFANILNYGKITIQTAGNLSNFVMEFVPDAIGTSSRIHGVINTYREVYMKKKEKDFVEFGTKEKIKDIIPE